MFGRKKKEEEEEARFLLMLFREGKKCWYKWFPLESDGRISEENARKHDSLIDTFYTISHEDVFFYEGDYGFKVKVNEGRLAEILEESNPGSILQCEFGGDEMISRILGKHTKEAVEV